jgi:protein-L-isoaspartate(D-aspartate) O-methyltransferase
MVTYWERKGNRPNRLSVEAPAVNDVPPSGAPQRGDMTRQMEDFAVARRKMVDSQLRTENVTDHEVLAAMGAVPREVFVPSGQKPLAYLDRDIALNDSRARSMMRPAPLARLLQLAEVVPADRAMVVGAGTGYAAAVLARLARSVVALESDPALAAQASRNLVGPSGENVEVAIGPLEAGYPQRGPYDLILLDGAIETQPDVLLDQLTENGRLVAVVGYGRTGIATLFARSDDDVGRRPAFDAGIPPLPGFRKPEVFVF